MQLAAFLCVICVICGRINIQLTQSIYTEETPISPADLADLRRRNPKTQNYINLTICLSLRDNAACCIPLRNLRYLRENIYPNLLNLYTQTKPQYFPQISLIHADKQQNSLNLKQPVFLCVIMQPAAFLCVICVICGRIFTQEYSINLHRRNPSVSR